VAVEGIPVKNVAFLASLLPRQASSGGAFVLDSRHRVIASTSTTLKTGQLPKSRSLVSALDRKQQGAYRYNKADRYFAATPLQGTTWSVVMTTTASGLYPALAGSQAWILYAVLAAFALACAASAMFFRRAIVTGAALQRTNQTLEERVAERTAAAEDRARELARSNQELEQFSSVASHDLQEPLRKVRMFGDRLRDRLGDAISAEAAEDLHRMQNAAERMQALINDLLDFSRVTHRGQPFAQVDLGAVAAEVVSDLEARILELDATVEVGELPVVHADPTQMRQLLQNLISNALKFHRPDVPPVVQVHAETLTAQAPRFAAEKVAAARYVLTVSDNGIGFEEQYAERIFSPFERLHARAAYEGTGIGLSIARKIVWRHGGNITATSAPGEGATFTITLPITPTGGDE
jgi:signal transduction histidine kinase